MPAHPSRLENRAGYGALPRRARTVALVYYAESIKALADSPAAPVVAARPEDTPAALPLGAIHDALAAWFEANARDLPWRAADCTPWGVLVSEVMLQQTPVVRVLPVWEEWLRRWPEPSARKMSSPSAGKLT